ncbi:MAG: hypothetical protein AB1758_13085 [Candidatus Eremiobacterota bacterium]
MNDRPWEPGPSIFSILESWTGPGEASLPDEAEGQIRWASGAQDGVRSHHMGSMEEAREAELVYRLVDLVQAAATREPAREELYRFCLQESILGVVDPLLEELERRDAPDWPGLPELARFLVTRASHREPLKLGIALLGLVGQPTDLDVLEALAEHDEFTLFAAVAGARLAGDPIQFWWRLARRVNGWGKIHLVERLAEHAEDRPDLARWLLEEGCENWVMPEYLAYLCATHGRLPEALQAADPGRKLLDGACLILGALLEGGPAEDIDDYAEGPRAVERLLEHLEGRAALEHLEFVQRLETWLHGGLDPGAEDVWAGRAARGWTPEVRQRLQARCAALLERPEWARTLPEVYASHEARPRQVAWNLAPRLKVDLWEAGFERLQSTELDAFLCWALLDRGTPERNARVLDWAQDALPLSAMASGPEQRFGAGTEHTALQFCLQFIQPEAPFRDRLVAAGLRSPSVSCRSLALSVLERTPETRWEAASRAALTHLAEDECMAELKKRALSLLAGVP